MTKMKLLIAEDNPAMRQMIRRLVAGLAEDICECGDGAAAVAAYQQARPDWVLMDLEMPGVNGLTAMQEIVRYDPAARVLIVTSHNDAGLRAAAVAAGACGYVLKENLWEVQQLLATPLPKLAEAE
jgi:CheY-like chemotaxis protein